MGIQIINCEQGTEEWFRHRLGVFTASSFASLMIEKGRGPGGRSKTRDKYLANMAYERAKGKPAEAEKYSSGDTDRGHRVERVARIHYESWFTEEPVTQVGFVLNDNYRAGCSPDAMVGSSGVLEIKSREPGALLALREDKSYPKEHIAQTQGNLLVTERDWIDLFVWCEPFDLQPFQMRTYRDEAYLKKLVEALKRYNDEVDEMAAKYGDGHFPDAPASLKQQFTDSILMAG